MSLMLPKTLERKLETFKKVKGSSWSNELEVLLDSVLDESVEPVLDRATRLSAKEAEAILNKRRKPVVSDRQSGKIAREAVIKIRQKRKSV
jgi:hypothetical protein